MANKPSIPKGTRDFSPEEMVKRNYLFDTIRAVFKKYGYQPIETPAMENIETLMGKYGDEGDKLIYKIRSNKNLLDHIPALRDCECLDELYLKGKYDWIPMASDKALRYDLTVPFARYVVQHQNEITFPFKRSQIQPVWRADNPQKGRYREFFQCDADVIGSTSLINEVELVQMVDEVFTALKVPVIIKINNRKILFALASAFGIEDKMVELTIAIDKWDKIGIGGVKNDLLDKGIDSATVDKIITFFMSAPKNDLLKWLDENLNNLPGQIESAVRIQGMLELKEVINSVQKLGLKTAKMEFDVTLARGLNYYTGAIFEVKVDREKCNSTFTSSITGGGRYDDLTGIFGLPNMSGVGISFGADRICDVLDELNLYPESVTAGTRLLFINKGGKSETISLGLLKQVREKNIAAEIYPDNVKWEKQMKYVDAKKIPFNATVEEDGKITLKFQENGKWNTLNVSIEELISKIG